MDCYDPWINLDEAQHEYGITPVTRLENSTYDGVVLAVAHKQFAEMGVERIRELGRAEHVLYDLKYVLPRSAADIRL